MLSRRDGPSGPITNFWTSLGWVLVGSVGSDGEQAVTVSTRAVEIDRLRNSGAFYGLAIRLYVRPNCLIASNTRGHGAR